jgi:hypothetical protein
MSVEQPGKVPDVFFSTNDYFIANLQTIENTELLKGDVLHHRTNNSREAIHSKIVQR